jgi:hypothetical protein
MANLDRPSGRFPERVAENGSVDDRLRQPSSTLADVRHQRAALLERTADSLQRGSRNRQRTILLSRLPRHSKSTGASDDCENERFDVCGPRLWPMSLRGAMALSRVQELRPARKTTAGLSVVPHLRPDCERLSLAGFRPVPSRSHAWQGDPTRARLFVSASKACRSRGDASCAPCRR